jgi:hypothetical protein
MLPARDPTLEPAVDRVLGLILTREGRAPHASLPKRLTALFRELRETATPAVAEEIQDLIWAHWCDHDEAAANELMQEGIAAMAAEEFEQARSLFDAGSTPRGAQKFPDAASFRISLSSVRSETARRSRAFSASRSQGEIMNR